MCHYEITHKAYIVNKVNIINMVKTEDTTLVRISREVKEYIESRGEYGESFNDILIKLILFRSPTKNNFMGEKD